MKCFGLSDIGLVRETNQDSFFYSFNKNEEFLAVVCDGIGGGKAGDVASQIAVTSIEKCFSDKEVFKKEIENKKWINDMVKIANDDIYVESRTSRNKHGMGTTLVGALITKKNTYLFHLGDSRVYGIYDDIICLTEDHNLAADLIKSGELNEAEALNHPKGKALTNALGIWSQYHVDINKIKKDYNYLLLCSDGLHGYVGEKIIKDIILESGVALEAKAQNLINAAIQTGGYDNIGVIIIDRNGGSLDE